MLSVVGIRPVYMCVRWIVYVAESVSQTNEIVTVRHGYYQRLVNCPKVVPNEPEFSQ